MVKLVYTKERGAAKQVKRYLTLPHKGSDQPPKPHHLNVFYDRSLRLWTITVEDVEGNQIGEAWYEPNASLKDKAVKRLKQDNNLGD